MTNLKDLGEVRVSVGEHCVDAVDGVLGLAGGPPLGFGLQYRQQNTGESRRENYKPAAGQSTGDGFESGNATYDLM